MIAPPPVAHVAWHVNEVQVGCSAAGIPEATVTYADVPNGSTVTATPAAGPAGQTDPGSLRPSPAQ